jgi:RNA polymerase-binding transcription factor DksA
MAIKKKLLKPSPVKGKSSKAVKAAPAKKAVTVKKAVKPVSKVVKPAAKKTAALPSKPTAKGSQKKVNSKNAKPDKSVSVKPAAKKTTANLTPIKHSMAKKTVDKKVSREPVKPTSIIKPIEKNIKNIKVVPPKPVVLPKINTKTSRTYQPDFTKSVLDKPRHDPGAPIVRYNDADLLEFRELIGRKLEAAKKELSYLQGLITRKDEMGGDESDNRYMTMEDGSLSMEREQLSQMASRQITFIDHLEKALMRIENKTYGICRVTGKLIDKARLRAVPHATLCIEAKMGMAK